MCRSKVNKHVFTDNALVYLISDVKYFKKAFRGFDFAPLRPLEQCALRTMRSCSDAQTRPCSNETTSTTMKKHVATDVVTLEHNQDTPACLIHNNKKEEPNKTQ